VSIDWAHISLKDLAALVSKTLREGGTDAVLVGGTCGSKGAGHSFSPGELAFWRTLKAE